MRNLFLFGMLFLVALSSCSNDGPVNNGGYFLKVLVNGETIEATSPIGLVGFTDDEGCTGTYPYTLQGIGQIDRTDQFVEAYIMHKQDWVDFDGSAPGQYSVKDYDFIYNTYLYGIPCNLDLVVFYDDNTVSDPETVLQISNRVHNVTSIVRVSETSNEVKYDITGDFSCSFKNINNVTIPISGSYKTFINVMK